MESSLHTGPFKLAWFTSLGDQIVLSEEEKNQEAINLGPFIHDDYLKFPNGDKVTNKTVENFCKRFVEKILADYITRIGY